MTAETHSTSGYDPKEQLRRLQQRSRRLAPLLYREQALYLQLLRNLLLPSVRTAVGHLLCERGQRLSRLSAEQQSELQQTFDGLVQRCSSLLTVEQLMDLSRRLQKEALEYRQQAQLEVSQSLQADVESAQPETSHSGIELSLSPPIEHPDLLEGLLPRLEGDVDPPSTEPIDELQQPVQDPIDSEAAAEGTSADFDLLRSLFLMAGEAIQQADPAGEPARLESDASALGASVVPEDQSDAEFLPSMPVELVNWFDGQEAALSRRIRNLSHALNVELLRAGLVSSLLPTTLLDAAIAGQLQALPSPSNLLRLKLPLPLPSQDQPLEILSILVRPADLEYDNGSLRHSRYRLRQHRSNLLTMVQQQRHWQSRLTSEEVHSQWWPNPPMTGQD
ncbi:hypothetical protein WB44_03555 [Synechococcus sp. WH 8020]|uniref:hypothetical protein n=1 Tax=Synechococcus sp. (strain WH8020) TaxID=32052 RepID=UPI00065274AA|nr:hypothetical protein [Synechococcus sp. WH 8020]AKN62117.1 hypothetical protein WB44_03555 [Synechococcus sp. WH 8020]